MGGAERRCSIAAGCFVAERSTVGAIPVVCSRPSDEGTGLGRPVQGLLMFIETRRFVVAGNGRTRELSSRRVEVGPPARASCWPPTTRPAGVGAGETVQRTAESFLLSRRSRRKQKNSLFLMIRGRPRHSARCCGVANTPGLKSKPAALLPTYPEHEGGRATPTSVDNSLLEFRRDWVSEGSERFQLWCRCGSRCVHGRRPTKFLVAAVETGSGR